jgi:hypothetical protein
MATEIDAALSDQGFYIARDLFDPDTIAAAVAEVQKLHARYLAFGALCVLPAGRQLHPDRCLEGTAADVAGGQRLRRLRRDHLHAGGEGLRTP